MAEQNRNGTQEEPLVFGYQSSPDQRGTLDIVWSCFLVVFICTWTALHTNLPSDGESYWTLVRRKARWALFAIFCPEAVTLIAGCQWASALATINDMHSLGAEHWTAAHGFFADSGGFVLCCPDIKPFPINTRALLYLVRKEYIACPTITKGEILDRSKSDRFAKLVALIQSFYLVSQCIARPILSQHISLLELLSAAFVFCTIFTLYYWIDKACDVEKAVQIPCSTLVETILKEAGDGGVVQWDYTPMDFVEQPGWFEWSRRPWFKDFGIGERPISRIPDDFVVPPKTLPLAIFLWLVTVAQAAIHVAAWNYAFPTPIEQYLWRVSSLAMFVVLFFWGLIEVLSVWPGFDFTITLLGIWEKRSSKDTLLRNWIVDMPATASATLYFVARTVVLAESLASLRAMPGTVYQNVSWTTILPAIG